MKWLLPLAALAATATAVNITLPLYIWPTNNDAQWQHTFAAIDSHPSLTYFVIINPSDGPPFGVKPGYPSEADVKKDWALYIDTLNKKSNVVTLGYVATGFGEEKMIPAETVKQGIDTYAAWTTDDGWGVPGTNYDIHMDGIFFDEVDAKPALVSRYVDLVGHAKSAIPNAFTILNPGVAVPVASYELFEVADAILNLETCYTADVGAPDTQCPMSTTDPSKIGYTPFRLGPPADSAEYNSLNLGLPDASHPAEIAKSIVVVHDFYEIYTPRQDASIETLTEIVDAIVERGVHSFIVTNSNYHAEWDTAPASIDTVSDLAVAAQGLARKVRREWRA